MKRQWLKDVRTAQGLTQLDVAIMADIERSYYTMIEQGKRRPSPEVSMRIAEALKFDWTIFFKNECNKTKQNKSFIVA